MLGAWTPDPLHLQPVALPLDYLGLTRKKKGYPFIFIWYVFNLVPGKRDFWIKAVVLFVNVKA